MNTIRFISLIIIVILFGCKNKDDAGEPTLPGNYSQSTLTDICTLEITENTGAFITAATAHEKLAKYKAYMKQTTDGYDAKKDIYGFVFGVDRVRELVALIDRINKEAGMDSLVGVRVYFARSLEHEGIPDVMFVPVAKNRSNILPIDDDFTVGMRDEPVILNTSVPCPNKCQ